MAVRLYVTKDVLYVFQLARGRSKLAEGCTGVKGDGCQRRFQFMGDSARDSFHAQQPVGALASLQSDGVGKSRIEKHCFDHQDGEQNATADQNKATSRVPSN